MIQKINTPLYMNASEITLDEFIRHAQGDFERRLCNIYNFADERFFKGHNVELSEIERAKNIKQSLYSLDTYRIFHDFGAILDKESFVPCHKFDINTKNINFTHLITNLKEIYRSDYPMIRHYDNAQNEKDNEHLIKTIKEIPNWENLFGSGEFPFMKIYVFRLGNTEYFAYDIVR